MVSSVRISCSGFSSSSVAIVLTWTFSSFCCLKRFLRSSSFSFGRRFFSVSWRSM